MTETEEAGVPDPAGDPPRAKQKGDRAEIVKVLVLALVSFLAGFALVLIFLRGPSDPGGDGQSPAAEGAPAAAVPPTPATAEPAPTAPAAAPAAGYEPAPTPPATAPGATGYEPAPAIDAQGGASAASASPEGAEAAPPTAAIDEGSAPAEVPPGKTPDGMLLDGDAFYLKCWDDGGVERKGADCDRLSTFEKRFSTRLYVIDKCRVDAASAGAEGKLSVAAEVDFQASKVSFWNAPSSDIANAAQIGSCMRGALAGLPIQGIEHRYARYRLFFTVLFGKTAAKKAAAAKEEAPAAGAEKAAAGSAGAGKPPAGKGKLVEVVKDKVRVRKAPVDGEVIGKIGQGNQVRLLKQKDGWCQVVTPSGNEGWMICDALGL